MPRLTDTTPDAVAEEHASARPLCASLRTKGMYLPPNAHADSRTEGGSATAVFWCLKTMKMTGPDDGFVSRGVCIAGRSCYTSSD